MRKRVSTGAFVVAVSLGLAWLGAGAANAKVIAQTKPETTDVKIDNFSFGPTELAVTAGTTITWTNRDDIPHTVVSTEKVFRSKVLDTNEQYSFTFSTPGTFQYFCSIHPKMIGTVVVK